MINYLNPSIILVPISPIKPIIPTACLPVIDPGLIYTPIQMG